MTYSQHLQWCKDRAIQYADDGDISGSYASMVSDMQKHDETKDHPAIKLGVMLMVVGDLSTRDKMVAYINGFN